MRLLTIAISLIWLTTSTVAGVEETLRKIKLPDGFSISLYAYVPGARSMKVAPKISGVFVGTRGDKVFLIKDKNLKGKPEDVVVFADGFKGANGVSVKDNTLFVSEQHRIVAMSLDGKSKRRVVLDDLPDKRHHGWRYTAFGPNDKLYVTVGSPCNVCRVNGKEGTILEVDVESGKSEIFARGVRNSVGIDFHPVSGELYFTDNGSDGLGDNIPADELNHAPRKGMHFGFPWFGGGKTRSGSFWISKPKEKMTPPIVEFQAHTASLGLRFYRGKQFPAPYASGAFIAQHGSWNRSTPIGYRVMFVEFGADRQVKSKMVFADGWLQGRTKLGRPVDVKELPDGSLLVSDDKVGAVYRITYQP